LSTLTNFRFTILDEADEMLNANWEEELKDIISGAGKST